jgi:two-component system OmpR family response regulator
MRVLVIEEDRELAHTLQNELKRFYLVDVVHRGHSGVQQAQAGRHHLIILDSDTPTATGPWLCREIRTHQKETPLFVLSSSVPLAYKIACLDAGADEYMTKPLQITELLAQVRALLRRVSLSRDEPLIFDQLALYPTQRLVLHNGQAIALRRKEFDLLACLMRSHGQVVTRTRLLDIVWHNERDLFSNTVDVHIKYLRDKVDRPFKTHLIQTVPGIGYTIRA